MRPLLVRLLPLVILVAAAPAAAQNTPPVVNITTPISFTLTQGSFSTQIQAVERAESAFSFYDYYSASSHTGFEVANESKLFLYRDTTTGLLSLFITHNIDFDTSGIPTGPGAVQFDISGVPPGAYVAQSDDPFQGGRAELDLALSPEGSWTYQMNTDGGVIDALATDQPWCITVDPLLFQDVTSWVYHYSSGTQIVLQMDEPVTICFEPPTDVDVLDVDEGNDASLSGSFDDPDSGDAHVAGWDFGDGQSAPATFQPGVGFTHHDCNPVFHAYGDDGSYTAVLSVDDDAGGHGEDSMTVNVHNVAPTLGLGTTFLTGRGIGLTIPATGDDPGSDDLTFTWDFGDGTPTVTNVHFNDGSGPDPYPSPDGIHPFDATDFVYHVWCEAGTYALSVALDDDDGGATARTATVTVLAVPSGHECNQDPACSAGPDVFQGCGDVAILGQATDPDGDPLTYAWTSSCTGTVFTPGPDVIDPVVTLPADCDVTCTLTLTVDDGYGGSCTDDAVVTLRDDVPPTITNCPAFTTVECDGAGNLAERQAWIDSFAATDDCSEVTLTSTGAAQPACGSTQREDRTFTATDACGNSVSCTATFGIVDSTRPAMVAGTIAACYPTKTQAEQAARAATTATDVCSEPVTLSVGTTGTCSAIITVIGRDECGNSQTVQYTTRIDGTAPVLSGIPADETVECDAVPAPATPSATDNCDSAPVITFSETRADGSCADAYTLTRTWTATDSCGNAASGTQVLIVRDSIGPSFSGIPGNVRVECDAVPGIATPTATDNCDPAPVITFLETRTDGPCPDTYLLARTWTATDRCGNMTFGTQIVTVVDEIAPVLAGIPGDVTVECDAVPAPDSPTASDDCDPAPGISLVEVRTDGPCDDTYTLTRTWTATDRCGNDSSESQVISVQDTTTPTLSGIPADETVECDAVPAPAMPTADDNCDPAPRIDFVEVRTNGRCDDTYTLTRTWTATDRCDNASSESQVISVQDTTTPTLSGIPADETVECDAVPAPAMPTADDNCDPAPRIDFVEVRTDGPCDDTYTLTRTWTATDRCGNDSSESQVISVQDTTTPTLSGIPADETVECDAVPAPAMPTAADNCDSAPRIDFTEVRTDGRCPGDYVLTRTWTATDRCDNAQAEVQVVTVVDTTAPVITPGSAELYCLWPPNHAMAGFSHDQFSPEIRDNCSDPITWIFAGCASDQPDDGLGDGNTDADCLIAPDGLSFQVRAERQGGEPLGRHYGVSIVATDSCGNASAAQVIGTIYVPHDQGPRERCIKTTGRRKP